MVPSRLVAQSAKPDSINLYSDFSFVKNASPWLTSYNAAGILHYNGGRFTEARLSAKYEDGGLADYYEGRKAVNAGGGAESFYRLGDDMVFYGKVEYDYFTGSKMAGSSFIEPHHEAFDIVENDISNLGRKRLNKFNLTGALGKKIYRELSLGAKLDYKTADYAKYKDLRHKNSLMDLTATVGLSMPIGTGIEAGLNIFYHRRSESLVFATYGNSDKVYKSLISYAAFMGLTETFGERGYTDKNTETPLFDEYVGPQIQFEWTGLKDFKWYIEGSVLSRKGYFGKKSPYTISHNQNKGHVIDARSILEYRNKPTVRHRLTMSFELEDLTDYSNSYYELRKDNNATYYQYYTPEKIASKTWIEARATYNADLGITVNIPAFSAGFSYKLSNRDLVAIEYPYFRKQNLVTHDFECSATKNIIRTRDIITFSGGINLRTGSGKVCSDGTYTTPSDKQRKPGEMITYLYRNYEFLTKTQLGGFVSMGFSTYLKEYDIKPFAKLGFGFRSVSDSEWLDGKQRYSCNLTIGMCF